MTSSSGRVVGCTYTIESEAAVIRFTGGNVSLDDDAALLLRGWLSDLDHEAPGRALVLDFSNVACIGITVLGVLVGLNRRMQEAGGRLKLRNVNSHVYEVFDVTRLVTLLDIDRPEPLAGRGGEGPP